MTIGPDPIRRILRMSSRLGISEPPAPGSGRTGAERRGAPVRLVALDPRLTPRALDREPVVLRGDLYPPRPQVLDRVVGAAVPEGKLEGVKADRAAQKLMAEADADHGPLADHAPDGLDDVAERRGIAGTVREKDEFR